MQENIEKIGIVGGMKYKMTENIKLLQGDCLELMKEIPDKSIDLVVTDPPYKIIKGGDSNGKNSKRPQGILKGSRNLFKYQNIKISDWMDELYRVLKEDSHIYIFTNLTNLKEMLDESLKTGFKIHNILIWEKNNCTPSQFYMKNCEYVLFLRKGKAKYINNIGSSKTVHKFNNIIGKKKHPCEKPVDLLQFYILNSSQENDIVLDPFMGSGSTGVACVNTNRKFIGMELDENYYQITEKRIEEEIDKEENDRK